MTQMIVEATAALYFFAQPRRDSSTHARYPFIETGSIGRSVMGRELLYLKIGNGGTEVCYSASFHANESITTPILLRFAEEYGMAYESGSTILGVSAKELYDRYTLFLIPMVNPDGVDLVNGALREGSYYKQAQSIAADYPAIPFPQGWKANIEGIDLNLQFPAGWENARTNQICSGLYRPGTPGLCGQCAVSDTGERGSL